MAMSLKELEVEAMKLTEAEREILGTKLLGSLEPEILLFPEWDAVIQRRLDEIERWEDVLVDGDEAFERIWNKYR